MDFTLITCNIRFDNPADGAHDWAHRRELLTNTLLKHQPHIIATQEGRHDQLMDLASLLPNYELVDKHRAWIKERMYPTLFIRKKTFELIYSEDLWLSETPEIAASRSFESAFPRLMTYMKVQPIDSKKNFLVINTHLDHIKSETRLGQINVLIRELKRFWQKEPLILMGDFNEGPNLGVASSLKKEMPQLKDAWKLFNTSEETSHHAFQGTIENGNRIDWILVDQSIQTLSCQMDKTQQAGLYPSDHYPIVCRVSL